MEKDVSITRDGNSIVEKSTIGGVEFEMRTTLNEVQERKDKDVDPTFHIKVCVTPTFVLLQHLLFRNKLYVSFVIYLIIFIFIKSAVHVIPVIYKYKNR